jgi:hypothetical protein
VWTGEFSAMPDPGSRQPNHELCTAGPGHGSETRKRIEHLGAAARLSKTDVSQRVAAPACREKPREVGSSHDCGIIATTTAIGRRVHQSGKAVRRERPAEGRPIRRDEINSPYGSGQVRSGKLLMAEMRCLMGTST